MSIEGTNRIIDRREIYARELSRLVSEKEHERKRGIAKSFIGVGKRLMRCSQCKRSFDAKIGNQQIENKRENAPICIPCIMGIPRKKLCDVVDKQKGWKKETVEKLKLWKKGTLVYKKKEPEVIPVESSPFIGFY